MYDLVAGVFAGRSLVSLDTRDGARRIKLFANICKIFGKFSGALLILRSDSLRLTEASPLLTHRPNLHDYAT